MGNSFTRWRMKMDSRWLTASAAFGGVAFFLRAVFYFGIVNLADIGVAELLFRMILPLLTLAAYFVILRGMRLQTPFTYGILGAAYCLMAMINCFYTGSVLRIILGCIWYLICGGLFIITTMGIISENRFACWVLFLAAAVRLIAFDLRASVGIDTILELAELLGICCFALMPLCLKQERRTRKRSKSDPMSV